MTCLSITNSNVYFANIAKYSETYLIIIEKIQSFYKFASEMYHLLDSLFGDGMTKGGAGGGEGHLSRAV